MALTRPRLLVSRSLGLGDLCTAVPALRGIARAFADHEMVLAAPSWQAPIARACGVERIVHVVDLDALPVGEIGEVDVAVNLHGSGPQSTQRLLDTEAHRVLAFRSPAIPETHDGPLWRDDEHEVARWCRLLGHYGIDCDPRDLLLPVPSRRSQPFCGAVVVHPGAAAAGRRWPAERFGAVVRFLRARRFPVVLTGSIAERMLCQAVLDAAGSSTNDGGAPVVSMAGCTELSELMAGIASARAVVSNDTGVSHLATAYGVPSLTLFGPTSPHRWGPPISSKHRWIWAGREGDPHATELDPGLRAITVGEVVAALTEMLEQSP